MAAADRRLSFSQRRGGISRGQSIPPMLQLLWNELQPEIIFSWVSIEAA